MAAGFGASPIRSGWCWKKGLSRTSVGRQRLGWDPDDSDKLLWKDILFTNIQYGAVAMAVTSDIAVAGTVDRIGATNLSATAEFVVASNVDRTNSVAMACMSEFAVLANVERAGVVSFSVLNEMAVSGNADRSSSISFSAVSEFGADGNVDRFASVDFVVLVEIAVYATTEGGIPPPVVYLPHLVGGCAFRFVS